MLDPFSLGSLRLILATGTLGQKLAAVQILDRLVPTLPCLPQGDQYLPYGGSNHQCRAGRWSALNVYSAVMVLAFEWLGLMAQLEVVAEAKSTELASQASVG